jgi:hypothetical protein
MIKNRTKTKKFGEDLRLLVRESIVWRRMPLDDVGKGGKDKAFFKQISEGEHYEKIEFIVSSICPAVLAGAAGGGCGG